MQRVQYLASVFVSRHGRSNTAATQPTHLRGSDSSKEAEEQRAEMARGAHLINPNVAAVQTGLERGDAYGHTHGCLLG